MSKEILPLIDTSTSSANSDSVIRSPESLERDSLTSLNDSLRDRSLSDRSSLNDDPLSQLPSSPAPLHSLQQVQSLLLDHSTPDSWINRQLGAQLVGQYGYDTLTPSLTLLLADKNEWVRYHAICSLERIAAYADDVAEKVALLKRDSFFRARSKALEFLTEYDARRNSTPMAQSSQSSELETV